MAVRPHYGGKTTIIMAVKWTAVVLVIIVHHFIQANCLPSCAIMICQCSCFAALHVQLRWWFQSVLLFCGTLVFSCGGDFSLCCCSVALYVQTRWWSQSQCVIKTWASESVLGMKQLCVCPLSEGSKLLCTVCFLKALNSFVLSAFWRL